VIALSEQALAWDADAFVIGPDALRGRPAMAWIQETSIISSGLRIILADAVWRACTTNCPLHALEPSWANDLGLTLHPDSADSNYKRVAHSSHV